ncbi:MAG: amidohydrolase family protein [Hyphomicrobiaceae bacterium]
MRLFVLYAVTAALALPVKAEQLQIFDAHIHYSHDAVKLVPPLEAARTLREAGLRRALVSSSDDNGTQLLRAAAPDLVVPALRPYRRRGETSSWINDPTIIQYVEDNLKKNTYFAIGEFHAFGTDIESPVVQRIIELAKTHRLLLHAHSDADAIERIFKTDPRARVLWAHSGFDRPESVRRMLRKHKNLWADLAFRNDHATGKQVAAEWRAAFEEFPDRFMVGTDTFAPERWYYVSEHAADARNWMSSLPPELARKIAYENAETMLDLAAPANIKTQ